MATQRHTQSAPQPDEAAPHPSTRPRGSGLRGTGARAVSALAAAVVVASCGGVPSASPPPTPAQQTTASLTPEPDSQGSQTGADTSQDPEPNTETSDPDVETVALPDPPAGWADILAQTRPSVVRLAIGYCDGTPSMGTGFVIGDGDVVTAAHVVDGASTITVQAQDGRNLSAHVVGIDSGTDSALIRVAESLGSGLSLAQDDPQQGTDLAVLGFPLGTQNLQMVTGIVSGESEPVDYGDQIVDPVFQTDAATNGGNSGGPVLDSTGTVIGLVSGGTHWDNAGNRPVSGVNYIVPATAFGPLVDDWSDGNPVEPTDCEGQEVVEAGPDGPDETPVNSDIELYYLTDDPTAWELAQVLYTHGLAINYGAWDTAFSFFTTEQQERLGGVTSWSQPLSLTWWRRITVVDVHYLGDQLRLSTEVTTEDLDPETFEPICGFWYLDYTFVWVEDHWLIDYVEMTQDSTGCTLN